ncbi:MAG: TIGR04066 family peptide maturation system protein [Lachnospiraceae bacterium]|nr:TIGR04066 family peptide maturation system protein [Lachnospiraceae bacterium]
MSNHINKAMLYPFSDVLIPIIESISIPHICMKITTVVDPKRKYLRGKDIGFIKNQPNTQIIVADDFDKELMNCDILIYTDEYHEDIIQEMVICDIEKALKLNKKVICIRHLTKSAVTKISKMSDLMKTEFHYLNGSKDKEKAFEMEITPEELYTPNASVIMVGELLKEMDGKQICLSIAEAIKAQGYKCTAVLEHKYAKAVQALSFPTFLRGNNMTEFEKIYALNGFIKYIDKIETPDAIILHIPEAMMKYNNKHCNGFGVVPYMISQAVHADCFVLCVQMDDLSFAFYNSLSMNFEHRFGFGVDFIHMSNKMYDTVKLNSMGEFNFTYYDQIRLENLIDKIKKNTGIPIFNSINKSECRKLSNKIIEKLIGLNEITSVLN